MRGNPETGSIRVRTLIEFAVIFLVGYLIIQVAPAVVLQVNFLNELEVAANAPVLDSAADIRQRVLETAEGYGITLLAEDVRVERNQAQKKTTIEVAYQLHINFWPRFTYVWNVRNRAEAPLF